MNDLVRHIDEHFGEGRPMAQDTIQAFTEYALRSADDLAVALGFAQAQGEIETAVVAEFTRHLTDRVAADLRERGTGWRVYSFLATADAPAATDDIVVITRDGWSGGSPLNETMRVALTYDGKAPSELYFQVKQRWASDTAVRPAPDDVLARRIAERASEALGRGDQRSSWWPNWLKVVDSYENRTTRDVLIELKRKDNALEYFATRLVRLSSAVDDVLRTPVG